MNNEYIKDFLNHDFCKFSNWLFSLDPYQFTLLATVIGFAITPTLNSNQQQSLGNFFDMVGQVLLTVYSQEVVLQQLPRKYSNFKKGFQTNSTESEILLVKEELFKMFDELYGNKK